ncbi:hypothetical protein K435DRAFT_461966 [Dendrothele bispora CBS 962.96]|uniref:F-box domain-containing protein n=1 Tax=Dendrothele bispora (strain CBS 962.96) TaxID=1314807 RepID=A0A4S8MCQ0_DENBC|nr:hypothetical protein K435DRAFT_461966 [Dendrothele bispora CBS 962.96]
MQDESDEILSGWPFLRLYDELESNGCAGLHERWPQLLSSSGGVRTTFDVLGSINASEGYQRYTEDPDFYRVFHFYRFFDSFRGFQKGSLDLSGRHATRLQDLLSRFHKLKVDVENLELKLLEQDGEQVPEESCWREFRVKWKMPRAISFSSFQNETKRISELIELDKFQIQGLCLQDLPFELLDFIFELSDSGSARCLAATSKCMHSIGLEHVYKDFSLTLRRRHPEHSQDESIAEPSHVMNLVKMFVDKCHHLSSRAYITDRLRSLSFSMLLRRDQLKTLKFRHESYHLFPFNPPIIEILRMSSNLTCLSVTGFALTSGWIQAISRLSQLRTIKLKESYVFVHDAVKVLEKELPEFDQVTRLDFAGLFHHFVESEYEDRDEWLLLALFPRLSTLNQTKVNYLGRRSKLPTSFVRNNCLVFSTLRHALFTDISWQDIIPLAQWMIISLRHMQSTKLLLTHLKLQMRPAIPDSTLIPFLGLLEVAPLEVLVLEGIQGGSLALFESLTSSFPDLRGLTLIRRETERQRMTKECSWPSRSWEYAPIFSNFRRLEYFGWNFAVPCDVYPNSMIMFEQPDGTPKEHLQTLFVDDEVGFDSRHVMAKMFAAYCKTFRMLALHSVGGNTNSYKVWWEGDTVSSCDFERREGYWAYGNWDPCRNEGWEVDLDD